MNCLSMAVWLRFRDPPNKSIFRSKSLREPVYIQRIRPQLYDLIGGSLSKATQRGSYYSWLLKIIFVRALDFEGGAG